MCTDSQQRATTHTIHPEASPTLLCVLLWRFLLWFSGLFTSAKTRSLWLLNRRVLLRLLEIGEVLDFDMSTSRGREVKSKGSQICRVYSGMSYPAL